jgi:hypothetical protein
VLPESGIRKVDQRTAVPARWVSASTSLGDLLAISWLSWHLFTPFNTNHRSPTPCSRWQRQSKHFHNPQSRQNKLVFDQVNINTRSGATCFRAHSPLAAPSNPGILLLSPH